MSLRTIRAEIAADEGIKIDTASEKAYLDDKINKAAQELYEQNDLEGCLREQIFRTTSSDQQISLPFYVWEVRLVRNYDYLRPITVQDMRPRYHFYGWVEPFCRWRMKYSGHPVERNISNVGPLTITLPRACTSAFTITVIGQTGEAQRIQEYVTFAAGEVSKDTIENYIAIESFTKNRVNNEDVVIEDMGGTQLAAIPNSELKSSYTILQIADRFQTGDGQLMLFEVLYKSRFTPMSNDDDSFICGDKFDRAIYFKTLELLYEKKQGEEALTKVLGCAAKTRQILEGMEAASDMGISNQLAFAPCPYYGLFDSYWFSRTEQYIER